MSRIHTYWTLHNDETPELLFAIDDEVVRNNPDEFERQADAHQTIYGDGQPYRTLIIDVPHDKVRDAFTAPAVPAEVVTHG